MNQYTQPLGNPQSSTFEPSYQDDKLIQEFERQDAIDLSSHSLENKPYASNQSSNNESPPLELPRTTPVSLDNPKPNTIEGLQGNQFEN